jgi:hypothetical protein
MHASSTEILLIAGQERKRFKYITCKEFLLLRTLLFPSCPKLPFHTMSTRQLRKLQQQRELEQAQAKLQAEEEEESEDEPVLPMKSKPSLFANLAALEDAEDEEDEAAEEEPPAELSEAEPTPLSASKKPKKSKKKKKGKGKAKEKAAESQTPQKPENGADEIDAALRELNLKKSAQATESEAFPIDPEYEKVCTLLGVNTQHLKVANEMRALFGRAATEIHDDPGGPTGRGARRRQRAQNQQVDLETALKGHHLPGKGLPELTLRRNHFIQGKDDWPKAPTGGLTMEVIDDPGDGSDGSVEFTYSHNKAYQTIQQSFHAFVEMGDPQNLIGLLVRNRKSHPQAEGSDTNTTSLPHIPPPPGQQNSQGPRRPCVIFRLDRTSSIYI